jgi:hypothetical protein
VEVKEEELPVVPRARVAAVAVAVPEPQDELEERLSQAMESVAAAAGAGEPPEVASAELGHELPSQDEALAPAGATPLVEGAADVDTHEPAIEPVAAVDGLTPVAAEPLPAAEPAEDRVEQVEVHEEPMAGPDQAAEPDTAVVPEAETEPAAPARTVIDEIEEVLASFYETEAHVIDIEPAGDGTVDVLVPARPGKANGAAAPDGGSELVVVAPPASRDPGREAR